MAKMTSNRILGILWAMKNDAANCRKLVPSEILRLHSADRSLAAVIMTEGLIRKISNKDGYSWLVGEPSLELSEKVLTAYNDYKEGNKKEDPITAPSQPPLFTGATVDQLNIMLAAQYVNYKNELKAIEVRQNTMLNIITAKLDQINKSIYETA